MKQLTTHNIVIVGVFIFTMFSLQVNAQWTTNASLNTAVSTAVGDQAMSNSIIEDGAGGAIIVWTDYRNGIYRDVYIQRLNALGIPQWTLNGVPVCTATSHQNAPYLVSDGQGGAIITWFDMRSGINNNDIYVQHVSASGVVLWANDGIPICTAANNQFYPVVVSDNIGGAIIAWEDHRTGGDSVGVYAQRVNGNGNTLWAVDGVYLCQLRIGERPQIATDNKQGAIVAWEDFRNGPFNREIFAQRISGAGNLLWGANGVSICIASNHQYLPLVLADGNSGAFIAWEDIRVDPLQDIYIQHIDSLGNTLWPTDGVMVCNANSGQNNPRMCIDMSGGVILSWYDYRNANWDIFTQRFNASGVAQWGLNGIAVCSASNFQQYPNMLSDGVGGAYITWHDLRDNLQRDIYAQRVDSAGNMLWTNSGIVVSIAAKDQMFPALIASISDAIIITWYDLRNGIDKDMYAQIICSNGLLAVDCKTAESTIDIQSTLPIQIFPNPTDQILYLQSASSFQNASVKVFDISGKIVLYTNKLKGPLVDIDLSTLKAGFYTLQLADVGQQHFFKLSKR